MLYEVITKAHPAQVRQFQGEGLNLGLGRTQFRFASYELPAGFGAVLVRLLAVFLKRTGDPFRQRRIGVKTRQFSDEISN